MVRALFSLLLLMAVALAAAQDPMDPVVPKSIQPEAVVTAPQATVTVPDRVLQVGEAFTLEVKLPGDGEYQMLKAELASAQVGAILIEESLASGPREFRLRARTIRAGEQALGPLRLTATPRGGGEAEEFSSQAFTLRVEELPAPAEAEEPAGYTGPLALPFNYLLRNLLFLLAALAAIGLLAMLFWLLARYMARERERRAYRPPVPPVVQALDAVRSLKSMTIFHAEGAEQHYTRLSQALRFYFEFQLGRPALEMTEDEVIDMVKGDLARLPKAERLTPVLRRSSMAKFARQEQAEKEAREDCETVESFLESERLRLEIEAQRAAARAGESGRTAA